VLYVPTHLAVVVPTKDRPDKIRALLDSLCRQTVRCGRIVIVDGGASIRDLILGYADRLPIEHHECRPPGQIRQRSMGIAMLGVETPLVACLDDDNVFEADAMERMVNFWNTCEADTAAVSFNVINVPPEPNSWVRRLFGIAGTEPGRVLPSGATTSNCQASRDYRTDWVCGGATVWRLEVLRRHPHRELPSRWAIHEDVIYSYPLSRTYPMYVCAGARVRHEHVVDYGAKRHYQFYGLTQTLWMMHMVETNPDLSMPALLWMLLGTATGRILAGAFGFQRRHLQFARGQIEAVLKVLRARLQGRDVASVIEAEAARAR
jgi:glycosyltransferase involved in cell wall biosynthesis